MLRASIVCAMVLATSCASVFAHDASAPSSPDEWKVYAKRWAKPTERAVLEHAQRAWQCSEVAVKPVGYGATVDDAGARTPYLEWSAMGCGKDAHFDVACTKAAAEKASCDLWKKHVTLAGLQTAARDDADLVVVDDAR